MNRSVFRRILMHVSSIRMQEYEQFLAHVPLLRMHDDEDEEGEDDDDDA